MDFMSRLPPSVQTFLPKYLGCGHYHIVLLIIFGACIAIVAWSLSMKVLLILMLDQSGASHSCQLCHHTFISSLKPK